MIDFIRIVHIFYGSAIPFLGIYPNHENMLTKKPHKNLHSSFIHISLKLVQMSTCMRMDKQTVESFCNIYNITQSKKKWITGPWENMNVCKKNYAEWKPYTVWTLLHICCMMPYIWNVKTGIPNKW